MNPPRLVSVLIPAKNAAATLQMSLESLRQQTYPAREVIVCDGGSTDGTVEIARSFGATVVTDGPERSRQLNAGFRASHGAYVYRIDADFTLDPGVIEAAVKACEIDGADAAAVPLHGAGNGFWQRVKALERECYRGDRLVVGVRFFRREVFKALGGFDVTMVAGEDYDIHNRLVAAGYRWVEIGPAETHWGEATSLSDIARKSWYYGRTARPYLQRHPRRAARQMIPLRGAFIRNWALLVRRPPLTGGLIILKIVQYLCAGLGLLFPMQVTSDPPPDASPDAGNGKASGGTAPPQVSSRT